MITWLNEWVVYPKYLGSFYHSVKSLKLQQCWKKVSYEWFSNLQPSQHMIKTGHWQLASIHKSSILLGPCDRHLWASQLTSKKQSQCGRPEFFNKHGIRVATHKAGTLGCRSAGSCLRPIAAVRQGELPLHSPAPANPAAQKQVAASRLTSTTLVGNFIGTWKSPQVGVSWTIMISLANPSILEALWCVWHGVKNYQLQLFAEQP